MAFTGHRSKDVEGRSAEELEAVRGLIRKQLEKCGMDTLCVSVAEGADTIACEEALALGMSLELYLPLPVEDFREDFADRMEAWPRAESLIKLAQAGGKHSLTVLEGERPECYATVNDLLLEEADLLLAVTTESPKKMGGASEMLSLAKEKGIPCVIINPLTQKISQA